MVSLGLQVSVGVLAVGMRLQKTVRFQSNSAFRQVVQCDALLSEEIPVLVGTQIEEEGTFDIYAMSNLVLQNQLGWTPAFQHCPVWPVL